MNFLNANLSGTYISALQSQIQHVTIQAILIHTLAFVPRSSILARANSRKLPCSTPDVTSGIGMSLQKCYFMYICIGM